MCIYIYVHDILELDAVADMKSSVFLNHRHNGMVLTVITPTANNCLCKGRTVAVSSQKTADEAADSRGNWRSMIKHIYLDPKSM